MDPVICRIVGIMLRWVTLRSIRPMQSCVSCYPKRGRGYFRSRA